MTVHDYNELNKKIITDKKLMDAYQKLYNGIYDKVSRFIPTYLSKQIPFIISAVFNTKRSLIIIKAFNEDIIKDDKTRKKIIYNEFILK